ncbi:hypothetical protein [Aliiglaciecola litoralis]|uniref:DUF4760 domain-containing protein n=1 Tax=Aliiglaciecola litoralis TaxID=582857 RepID=A0ABN1LMB6_9ALTE
MDAQEFKLQVAEVVGTWIAALAVVIGGIFGVFQYLEHKSAVRVDRSMAFVERYHSDGLLMQARLRVTQSMSQHVTQINAMLTDPNIAPNELATLYHSEIVKVIKRDELSGSLEQIFTFYEQIILCRELNLCDAAVGAQFFDTDGRAFLRTFYPHICHIRKQWNNPDKYQRVLSFYIKNSDAVCKY